MLEVDVDVVVGAEPPQRALAGAVYVVRPAADADHTAVGTLHVADLVLITTACRWAATARPSSSSLWYGSYMSAVSK